MKRMKNIGYGILAAVVAYAIVFSLIFGVSLASLPADVEVGTYEGSGKFSRRKTHVEAVRRTFEVDYSKSKVGFDTAHDAALAFYTANEDAYQATNSEQELVGFIIRTTDNRYYSTTANLVPATFILTAAIRKPSAWKIREFIHTHPPTKHSQEGFSRADTEATMSRNNKGMYVRTPRGRVRFMNRGIARGIKTQFGGALGLSICPTKSPCMATHQLLGEV